MRPGYESYRPESNQDSHTSRQYAAQPKSPANYMDTNPRPRGDQSATRRLASPASSFLAQLPLNGNENSRGYDNDDAESGEEHQYAVNNDSGHDQRRAESTPALNPSNALKRSAPVEETTNAEGTKRLRQVQAKAGSIDRNTRASKVDATTQTGNRETISAKIALLQEEEVKAKAEHEAEMRMAQARYEAEVARRRQKIAELEYESKMSALRELSEMSTDKSTSLAPTVFGNATQGNNYSTRLQTSTGNIIADASVKENEIRQTTDAHPKAKNASKSTLPSTSKLVKLETASAIQSKAAQSSSTTKESPVTPSAVNGSASSLTAAPVPDKLTVKPPPAPARRDSARSDSLVNTTSWSPPPGPRVRPTADALRVSRNEVKHLTCYFWKHTGCSKTATECNYAHYDTGVTATDPERLRRNKHSGRGDWHTTR
ncbi:MAG: hypothetical protein Q9182_004524 [Xanthomendoza sp. 2 TL-2023]